jgi:hypothetical protein
MQRGKEERTVDVVETIPGGVAVVVSASSRHTTENTRIPSLARKPDHICLTSNQTRFQCMDGGKSANQIPQPPSFIQEAAYCSGFNSFVMVPNFMVPCLMVRFFDQTGPRC